MTWHNLAACRGRNTKEFYQGVGEPTPKHIVALCDSCPVQVECLDWAVRHEPAGIWGGTTERERRRMRRRSGISFRSVPTPVELAQTAEARKQRARRARAAQLRQT